MPKSKKFITLIILDGWGIAPPTRGNAISLAKTPVFDDLVKKYKVFALQSSGELVGLPWGEMGNSEVGHLAIGTGRIIYQSLPRITRAVANRSFFKNEAFLAAAKHVKKHNSALHFVGLVSDGGVHSLNEHLYALLELSREQHVEKVFIHAILDGRDTARDVGENFIAQLQERMTSLGVGKIATVSGRYYALDRDNRWDRTEKAYLAMTKGESDQTYPDPMSAVRASYEQAVYDEEFVPVVISKNDQPTAKISNNDAVVFFNFRPDRARQLTKAFVLPGFSKFERLQLIENLFFVSMTEYEKDLPVSAIAFPKEKIKNSLAETLSGQGLRQLHVAETEKYPHVTFFFNGGQEKSFPKEERVLIPSPSVASYDSKPKMSVYEVRERLVSEIRAHYYDFIVTNLANADMVGHTGNLKAAVRGIEAIDNCLGEIVEAVLGMNGILVITADHGNAEEMINPQTGDIIKEHSSNPVPCIFVAKEWQGLSAAPGGDLSHLKPAGFLADIAPTILKLYGIEKPADMTGRTLF